MAYTYGLLALQPLKQWHPHYLHEKKNEWGSINAIGSPPKSSRTPWGNKECNVKKKQLPTASSSNDVNCRLLLFPKSTPRSAHSVIATPPAHTLKGCSFMRIAWMQSRCSLRNYSPVSSTIDHRFTEKTNFSKKENKWPRRKESKSNK